MKVCNKQRLSNEGKRSIHVKYDGKTIALGTFPDKVATIMCKRAKALTKKWRVIIPKPSLEWVKNALEAGGIRVVNDKPGWLGRKYRYLRKNRQPSMITPEGEGRPVAHKTQLSSLSPLLTIQPHLVGTVTRHPLIDSCTDITEEGGISSERKVHTSPPVITPNGLGSPIGLLQDNNYPPIVTSRTNSIETGSQVQDQIDGDFADPDAEDLALVNTHAMLERHYANLAVEMEETNMLLNFYKEKSNEGRSLQDQHHSSQNCETVINRQSGIQTDQVTNSQAHDPPMQNCPDVKRKETSVPEETSEMYCPMIDITRDNDSITEMLDVERWLF